MNVPVFVPKGPLAIKIRPGSGIVGGQILSSGRQMVYFEGNLYGARDLQRYVERVSLAYGRMLQKYPTVAKAAFAVEELVQIGEYDPARMVVLVEEAQRAALKAWLGLQTVTPEQLIWRNPLQVRTIEQFFNIVGTTSELREFNFVEPSGALTRLRCFWDDQSKGVRAVDAEVDTAQLEPMIASGRLYLVLTDVSWGVGW